MSSSDNPFEDRPTCSSCNSVITARASVLGADPDDDDEELLCPTCRMGDSNRKTPELECTVCGDYPIEDTKRRALEGETRDGVTICFLKNGRINVHFEDDGDDE